MIRHRITLLETSIGNCITVRNTGIRAGSSACIEVAIPRPLDSPRWNLRFDHVPWIGPLGLEGASFVLEIVNYPHPALRYASRPVTEIDDDLRATVRTMFDLMYAAKGIGLAANQVALPFRFFILNLTADPEQKDQEQVFINPEIVKRHSAVEDEEGCLSLPGVYAKVRRAKKIRVRAYDLEGNLVEHEADELFSRAVQHETDHLEGKLFIDYLEPLGLKLHRGEAARVRSGVSPGTAERRDPLGRRPGARGSTG